MMICIYYESNCFLCLLLFHKVHIKRIRVRNEVLKLIVRNLMLKYILQAAQGSIPEAPRSLIIF